eukprot:1592377-Rhodomonas_salina.1
MDGAAFMGGARLTWGAVSARSNVQLSPGTFRPVGLPPFDAILHLQSTAVCGRVEYSKTSPETKTMRVQELDAARKSERKLLSIYASHSQRLVVPCDADFMHKTKHLLFLVANIMARDTC